MKNNIAQTVRENLEPLIEKMGYDLVDVEFSKKSNGDNLTVFIDKVGGVTLDDCVAVHEAIDEPLDELDPTHGASYTLNVSSPGLDRPLKTDKDLARNVGLKVEANTFVKVGDAKHFEGVLTAFDAKTVTLDINGNIQVLTRDNISKLNKFIEF